MSSPEEALKTAIRIAGGPVAAARELKISRQALSRWERAPLARVVEIERLACGRVTREELRPDIFVRTPAAAESEEKAGA